MIENELRESFTRHEAHDIELGRLRSAIDTMASRRRRKRLTIRLSAVTLAVVAAVTGIPVLIALPGTPKVVDQVVGQAWPSRALNILMVGLDDAGRSDNVTILQIPADRSKVFLVSIERDVLVDIPGAARGKLADTHQIGGVRLTESVVSAMTGLSFDATVSVTGPAIGKLAGAAGGIDICLPRDTASYHRNHHYLAGCRKYTGEEVADLVRQRWAQPNGGYDRDRNAHRVLAGLAAAHPGPSELMKLLEVDGIAIDTRGKSLLLLAEQLRQLEVIAIVGIGQPTYRTIEVGAVSYQELDPEVAKHLFAALNAGSMDKFVVSHPDWVTQIQR